MVCVPSVPPSFICSVLVCHLTCQNEGTVNKETCACDCAEGYSGPSCEGECYCNIPWFYGYHCNIQRTLCTNSIHGVHMPVPILAHSKCLQVYCTWASDCVSSYVCSRVKCPLEVVSLFRDSIWRRDQSWIWKPWNGSYNWWVLHTLYSITNVLLVLVHTQLILTCEILASVQASPMHCCATPSNPPSLMSTLDKMLAVYVGVYMHSTCSELFNLLWFYLSLQSSSLSAFWCLLSYWPLSSFVLWLVYGEEGAKEG